MWNASRRQRELQSHLQHTAAVCITRVVGNWLASHVQIPTPRLENRLPLQGCGSNTNVLALAAGCASLRRRQRPRAAVRERLLAMRLKGILRVQQPGRRARQDTRAQKSCPLPHACLKTTHSLLLANPKLFCVCPIAHLALADTHCRDNSLKGPKWIWATSSNSSWES